MGHPVNLNRKPDKITVLEEQAIQEFTRILLLVNRKSSRLNPVPRGYKQFRAEWSRAGKS